MHPLRMQLVSGTTVCILLLTVGCNEKHAVSAMNGGFFYKALVYSAFELLGRSAAACTFRFTHEVDTLMRPPLSILQALH